MDIDKHFDRLEGIRKDATYWKATLLDNSEDTNKHNIHKNTMPNFLTDYNKTELVSYDQLKCIELQNPNGLTPADETTLFDKLPKSSTECFLIYLNILLKRQQLPITCDKLQKRLLNFYKTTESTEIMTDDSASTGIMPDAIQQPKVTIPDPLQRRIGLLIGISSINSVFEEDDLLVLHLLHSKQIVKDFDLFASNTNYRDDLILDFILYDCEQAKFLQVLLNIFKNKSLIQDKYPELKQLLDNLVITLKKCKESLIYNPQVLINYWEKKS